MNEPKGVICPRCQHQHTETNRGSCAQCGLSLHGLGTTPENDYSLLEQDYRTAICGLSVQQAVDYVNAAITQINLDDTALHIGFGEKERAVRKLHQLRAELLVKNTLKPDQVEKSLAKQRKGSAIPDVSSLQKSLQQGIRQPRPDTRLQKSAPESYKERRNRLMAELGRATMEGRELISIFKKLREMDERIGI
jgi:hypothetical protein